MMSNQAGGVEGEPNQTIYVNNLNDKIKAEELKTSLYFLFSQFGEVVEIVIKNTNKMRGQAFVIFRDINATGYAIKALQGFNFFEKPMVIVYKLPFFLTLFGRNLPMLRRSQMSSRALMELSFHVKELRKERQE
eukprot:TRINITY_DN3239_c0_g5_i1.p1 TRINITY_DN3239_c0_g5~~TRINITY_DN3239_c0_g5_i1.p1  ORF type:complete len:134 (-),score=21.47 TRINITY_DN3239_c0_g5_i1:515-916(-)